MDLIKSIKFKRIAGIFCSVTLCLFMLAGCNAPVVSQDIKNDVVEATPTPKPASGTIIMAPSIEPSPTPSPTPTPTPIEPPDADYVYNRLKSVDITDYIIPNTYERDEEAKPYEVITGEPELTYKLPELFQQWFNDAANSLASLEIRNIKTKLTPPSWQLLSTLVYNYSNDVKTLRNALVNACNYEIGVYKAPGGYSVEITATPRNPMDVFYLIEPNERVTPLSNMTSYAYLATVYDNNMNVRDGIEERELEPFLFPIANPGEYVVGDTWYASRDGGTRRHTGTDINAPEGTGLLAVRDGVILDVGTTEKGGNHIILLGDDGNQYHYYHMVEPTTFLAPGDKVKRGDLVGRVGNTGNSTANHLHFTIITEDGYLLNPYKYLKEAQKNTVAELSQSNPTETENAQVNTP